MSTLFICSGKWLSHTQWLTDWHLVRYWRFRFGPIIGEMYFERTAVEVAPLLLPIPLLAQTNEECLATIFLNPLAPSLIAISPAYVVMMPTPALATCGPEAATTNVATLTPICAFVVADIGLCSSSYFRSQFDPVHVGGRINCMGCFCACKFHNFRTD